MDVGDWLRGLGLGQYERAFRENAVDADILPELTDDHLKDIGVPLGHRLKMLRAIKGLAGQESSSNQYDGLRRAEKGGSAERRQLTVMFCDLVGSTAMSSRLDPEDMRDIIGAYHRCCATLIARHGGFVAKYMGDGVLAYFGYPQAHEHDAERAVQAALAIVETAPKLQTVAGSSLQVRIGIATGIVVVGDLLGSGEAQERGIVGDTPNLAARLQSIAEPDSVVIADGTRRLLGGLFELRDLGLQDLKGVAAPTRAWAAVRTGSAESRFEALHGGGLTAIVGREEEIEALSRCWSLAKAGEGQVALLSGEAGIGKSRLTAALLERLVDEPHTRLRYFCSPQHTDSSFYPIIGQLQRAAGLTRDDASGAALDKIDALLAQSATDREDVALIAEMLSLPNDGRHPALELPPAQRRQRTLEALLAQTEALARQNPVLMIFEDAHWADPTSLEVFGRVVDRIRTLRALLVVTFRPEFDAPWTGQPHVTALTVGRLTQRDVVAMIDRVVGNKLIPPTIRQDIIERTDGIPLFVEEMTKAVLEAGSEGEARQTAATVPSPALAVPASLHASLLARLDRLGAAKEVAQIGAVIGREFSHALLAAVVDRSQAGLESALDRLASAGLLFAQGEAPNTTYLFKHALVQDAAYGTLLRDSRRALHARIADALEAHFPATAEKQPELVARHCAEAGLIEKAACLWGKAGQRSVTRSAYHEAVEQLGRALALIAALPGTTALRRDEIKFQVDQIVPLYHTKGFAAPETRAAATRAQQLIEQAQSLGEPPEDPLLLFSVLTSFWAGKYVAFDGDAMCSQAAQILALAKLQAASPPLMLGHRIMGMSLVLTGRAAESEVHLAQAMTLYDPAKRGTPAAGFSQDDWVTSLLAKAWARWFLGYPDAALLDAENALKTAREIGQAGTLMYALGNSLIVQILCGNLAIAAARAREQTVLAEEKNAAFWKAFGLMNQGRALDPIREPHKAIELIAAGIALVRATGAINWLPFYFVHLARSFAELGRYEEARRQIDEALTAVETTKERWCEPEVHRTAGKIELMSATQDSARARAYFARALETARAQKTKSWELRAAMSIACLSRDEGGRQYAYDLLAPVYGWFTEGFDTSDLRQAKALLEELRGARGDDS